MSKEQLVLFQDLIYKTCGLWFNDSKLSILENRIRTRMKDKRMENPAEYFQLLSRAETDRAELSTLINILTTNETYFYRSETQIDSFMNVILPKVTEKKIASGNRSLNIWSAGCSTGEEPYTLAMCLMETIKFHTIWDLRIFATDISTEVLAKAMEGVYNSRAVERLPEDYLKKYFRTENGKFILSNTVKKFVEFEYTNLVDSYYETGFDIIFCRNVLIYFKDETKANIISKFHDSLNDNGYLFLGPTEMIRGLTEGFKMIPLKEAVVFQKVSR